MMMVVAVMAEALHLSPNYGKSAKAVNLQDKTGFRIKLA
jgi:hypothetical protein